MSEQHVHEYRQLYKQPKIKEGILIAVCDCGAIKEQDAEKFFEQAHKERVLYLFDFNSTPPEEIEHE